MSPTTAVPNQTLTYTVTIPNTGTASATNVTLTDAIPAGTTYVAGSTTLNGVAVADRIGQTMPFAQGGPVNSPGEPAGQVNAGEAATVQFQVRVEREHDRDRHQHGADRPGRARTTAADQPVGGHPGDAAGGRGGDEGRTGQGHRRHQRGLHHHRDQPGPVERYNVLLNDSTPQGLTFVSNAGDCTSLFPCSFGTLASGATRTVTATYSSSRLHDTRPDREPATMSSTTPIRAREQHGAGGGQLNAPVAALAVTKSTGSRASRRGPRRPTRSPCGTMARAPCRACT